MNDKMSRITENDVKDILNVFEHDGKMPTPSSIRWAGGEIFEKDGVIHCKEYHKGALKDFKKKLESQ